MPIHPEFWDTLYTVYLSVYIILVFIMALVTLSWYLLMLGVI